MYTLDKYAAELRRIMRAHSDYAEIFDRVAPLAKELALAKRNWLRPEHHEVNEEQGFGVHLLRQEPDHSLAIFAVAWGPGRGAPPHDHGTWAVVAGVDGVERNIKYNRLDDRSRDDYAELEERCTFVADVGDVVCLRPRGIHAVWNDNEHVTISLHTYGRHVSFTDRSAFDLETKVATPFRVKVE